MNKGKKKSKKKVDFSFLFIFFIVAFIGAFLSIMDILKDYSSTSNTLNSSNLSTTTTTDKTSTDYKIVKSTKYYKINNYSKGVDYYMSVPSEFVLYSINKYNNQQGNIIFNILDGEEIEYSFEYKWIDDDSISYLTSLKSSQEDLNIDIFNTVDDTFSNILYIIKDNISINYFYYLNKTDKYFNFYLVYETTYGNLLCKGIGYYEEIDEDEFSNTIEDLINTATEIKVIE